ncbi:MAG: nuclease-related domain-containing protein [Candidatus Limnocylindrales bacterium]
MKVIAAASPRPRARTPSVAGAIVGGALLVAFGLGVVVVIVASGMLLSVGQVGNSRITQQLFGTATWGLAFLIPGLFIVLGLARIVRAVEARPRRRRDRPAASQRSQISDDFMVAQLVRLPDGRTIPEIVVGPHGLTVVEELPPRHASRQASHHWEVRDRTGRWTAVEHPLDHAARDVERLRRWLGNYMEDYTPRFTAVCISEDDRLPRSSEVAVIRRGQLAAFLGAQPPLRQMTSERRERIAGLLGDLVEE